MMATDRERYERSLRRRRLAYAALAWALVILAGVGAFVIVYGLLVLIATAFG